MTSHGVDPFPMCSGSEQAPMAQHGLCQRHSQLEFESMMKRLAFRHAFIHSITKYFLINCYVSDIVLGFEYTTVTRIDKFSALMELTF